MEGAWLLHGQGKIQERDGAAQDEERLLRDPPFAAEEVDVEERDGGEEGGGSERDRFSCGVAGPRGLSAAG